MSREPEWDLERLEQTRVSDDEWDRRMGVRDRAAEKADADHRALAETRRTLIMLSTATYEVVRDLEWIGLSAVDEGTRVVAKAAARRLIDAVNTDAEAA
jgi:hypothetical protein